MYAAKRRFLENNAVVMGGKVQRGSKCGCIAARIAPRMASCRPPTTTRALASSLLYNNEAFKLAFLLSRDKSLLLLLIPWAGLRYSILLTRAFEKSIYQVAELGKGIKGVLWRCSTTPYRAAALPFAPFHPHPFHPLYSTSLPLLQCFGPRSPNPGM